jgi:hypothetical protein
MTKDFKARLKAIEQRINAKPSAGTFRILLITGCLPGPINFAYAGTHRWDRADGEDFDAFVQRSAYAAFEAGEMAMNVGGLPRDDELARFATSDGGFAFDDWWETVAPYYPEVPDPEPVGYRRPTPVMRAIGDR